jgi:hypothetical protein
LQEVGELRVCAQQLFERLILAPERAGQAAALEAGGILARLLALGALEPAELGQVADMDAPKLLGQAALDAALVVEEHPLTVPGALAVPLERDPGVGAASQHGRRPERAEQPRAGGRRGEHADEGPGGRARVVGHG